MAGKVDIVARSNKVTDGRQRLKWFEIMTGRDRNSSAVVKLSWCEDVMAGGGWPVEVGRWRLAGGDKLVKMSWFKMPGPIEKK